MTVQNNNMPDDIYNITNNIDALSFRNFLEAQIHDFTIQMANFKIIYVSEQFLAKLGYTHLDQLPAITEIYQGITEDELIADRAALQKLPLGKEYKLDKIRYVRCADGKISVYRVKHCWFKLNETTEKMLIKNFTDLSIESHQNNFNSTLLRRNPAILLTQDQNWKLLSVSEAWEKTFGYTKDETLGRDFADFLPAHMVEANLHFRENNLKFIKGFTAEKNYIELRHKSGHTLHVEIQSAIEEINGELINLISLIDVTELTLKSLELNKAMRTDSLTGLLNRRGLDEWLANDPFQGKFSLFIIDIDDFKSVNDSYGHDAGDALLALHSQCLINYLGDNSLSFRMGGEEFLVIQPICDWEAIEDFGNEIRLELSKMKFMHGGVKISRSVSIGAAKCKQINDFNTVLTNADHALYSAKTAGKNKIVCATKEYINARQNAGLSISLQDIRIGLHRKEFSFDLQPIYSLPDNQVVGYEAFMRWRKPDGQIIFPENFSNSWNLLFAGNKNLDLLHQLLLETAKSTNDLGEHFISFNLPAFHFSNEGSADRLLNELSPLRANHKQQIIIELQCGQKNNRQGIKASELIKLKKSGIKLAYDGFTLSDSIIEVFNYPFDIVKLDTREKYWENLSLEVKSVTNALISSLKEQNLIVIASGIDTKSKMETLLEMNVNIQQGYYLLEPFKIN